MSNLLEELKKEVSEVIETMTEDNLTEVRKKVDKYFKLATVMIDLMKEDSDEPDETTSENTPKATEIIPKEAPLVIELATPEEKEVEKASEKETEKEPSEEDSAIKQLADSFEKNRVDIGYPLSRNLYGGFLLTGNASDSIFVPESVCRNLELEDGDIVSAEVIPGSSPSKPFYKYELIRKGTSLSSSKRKEFRYGIVEFDSMINRMYVEKDIYGNMLKVDDAPIRFMISKEDERHQDLHLEDIVDIAWYENNFNKGRIVWRHSVKEVPTEKTTQQKKMLNYKSSTSKKEPSQKKELNQFLEGKTICLIGIEPNHAEYKEVVESRGGKLIALTSDSSKVTMSAAIRKSDLVLVGISHTGHAASKHANERAKHYGTPFKAFSGFGKSKFLSVITETLKINTVSTK